MKRNKPMVSPRLIKKWKKYIFLTGALYLIFFIIIYSYLLIIGRQDLITVSGLIFFVIFILSETSLFLNYLRWPVNITIKDTGVEYVAVSSKKRLIKWTDICDIHASDNSIYLIYQTFFGKTAIPIIKEEGVKIKEAWEEWKRKNIKIQ